MADSPRDPIDASLLELLTLFEGPLQAVSFPDVDRGKLGELADGVRRAAEEVAQARALLDAAETALAERQQALVARSQRALAYAHVYAADDPELRGLLERIAPRADPARVDTPAPRRRGRPRKSREAPLFGPQESDEATAAE